MTRLWANTPCPHQMAAPALPSSLGLQLSQHARPRQQVLQPAARRGPEPPGGIIIEPTASRGHHALHLAGARRLHLLAVAAPPQRGRQPIPVRLRRARLLGRPPRPAVLIVLGRRPGPVDPADLRPVVLDRPGTARNTWRAARVRPSPATPGSPPQPAGLLRGRPGTGRRSRRTSASPQPEARHACLVRDQVSVTLDQRPCADQLVRLPLSPHLRPFIGDCRETIANHDQEQEPSSPAICSLVTATYRI